MEDVFSLRIKKARVLNLEGNRIEATVRSVGQAPGHRFLPFCVHDKGVRDWGRNDKPHFGVNSEPV